MNSFKKLKSFNKLKSFKNLSFYSKDSNQILEALRLLHKLDYSTIDGCFNTEEAVAHNGLCAWNDGEISEGWLVSDAGFRQVTLEELKEMVGEGKEVLWLNIETLEERVITDGKKFYSDVWVKVPDGATFATGDKDNFVFRKDGFYYEHGEWINSDVTIQNIRTYEFVKLFWAKSDVKDSVLSNNFTVAWEQVFGEKFVDSVIKAVKQNKDNTMKNDMFTLERLLGCEVKIKYSGVTGYVTDVIDNGYAFHICCVSSFDVVSKYYLTFFTEDDGEVTFDEYVNMYYGTIYVQS